MDRLETLGTTLSQITMYDIKSAYNQAKNIVLNVSEMEAKVREATNDEPWGASSTLMQEIAQGTFSFQHFNEIMPCVYARFMEKEARQWRQIYKALQLLEYLIKHGSERVVDDARSHISTLKMLRNFHYIDDKGKDEGINVRNRSKELVELLSDVEKIRTERRKAKANRHKFTGTGHDGSALSFNSGGGRFGGFGSDSYNSGGSYGNDYGAGSSAGPGSSSFRDDRRGYEEYNAGDDEISTPTANQSRTQNSVRTPTRKASVPQPQPAPVEDLLGGFDEEHSNSTTSNGLGGLSMNKDLPTPSNNNVVAIDDDDFADFQAAPVQLAMTTGNNAPTTGAKPTLMEMLNSTTARPPVNQAGSLFGQVQPTAVGMNMTGRAGMGGMHRTSQSLSSSSQFSSPVTPQTQIQTPNFFGGTNLGGTSLMNPTSSATSNRPDTTLSTQTKPAAGSSANFDDLWSMSLGSGSAKASGTASNTVTGKSIKDLEREKAMTGLWGGQKPARGADAFGSFGNTTSGGSDDLLL